MDAFFTPGKLWAGYGPFLHFLVLLNRYPAYRAFARAHADLLTAHPFACSRATCSSSAGGVNSEARWRA
ncbi:hypothetical protein [Streptomyces sp. NPDC058583]|uniref:hypothetical protein n=1 Tax=unclassified Streptomyces TaxID=2593676 RepID=UPI00364F3788